VGTDSQNWARELGRNLAKEADDVVSTAIDAAKTAEAISIVGAAEVERRGGVNAQGYFNDVPAYQQLTANERKSVTLPDGTTNTNAMLAILNKKSIAAGQGSLFSQKNNNVNVDSGDDEIGVSTPSATPTVLPQTTPVEIKPPVKTAPIDTILIDQDEISTDFMTDLIFEDIGGQELINVARNDTVNGQTISYQPIKNLTSIQQQYNPNNILSLQDTSDKYFINFPIKLENYVLNEGNGSGPSGEYVYIDTETGDLIIELANLETDQQLEVEISQSGTIYEAEFN
jgi:hypothetical protein